MATGVYKRTKDMKTGKHMKGRTPWNKGNKAKRVKKYSENWTKEKEKEYQREWVKNKMKDPTYKKRLSEKTRNWQKKNPLKASLSQYRTGAKNRNIAFELNADEFESIVTKKCFYCNRSGNPLNGIDRIDSSEGYFLQNCTPCCRQCNIAKNSYSLSEFKEMIIRIYQHLILK